MASVIVITAILSILVLTLLYFYLYLQYRDRYLGLWALSLFVFTLGPAVIFLTNLGFSRQLMLIGEQFVVILHVTILIWGVYAYLEKKISKWWICGSVLSLIWTMMGIIFNFTYIFTAIPAVPFISYSYIWIALRLLRKSKQGEIGKVVGHGFILAGINRAIYPFVPGIQFSYPFGYSIAMVLCLFLAVGILLVYFQGIRRDLMESKEALKESEERYRFMAQNARDVIFRYRIFPTLKWEYISPAVTEITSFSPEEHYADPKLILRIVHPDFNFLLESMVTSNFDYSRKFVLRLIRKNGESVWLEQHITPFTDEKGKVVVLEGIGRDVTERIHMEEQLKYLSLHDSLTGLFNRAYFEQACLQFQDEKFNPLGIVICDIDGLKLINDSMGHDAGDLHLLAATEAIKEAFGETEIIARIGGDEFAVLLPNCQEETSKVAIQKMRDTVMSYNAANMEIHLSMSVGSAIRKVGNTRINDLFKEADNNMYREKLYRSRSARGAIIMTLRKAMEARDFMMEGHAERLQDLVAGLVLALGLSERHLTDLRLLAQFHDIGKVGIPDRILFKSTPLTMEEAVEMQRHCEVGYRIAQSSPDLLPIADWILKHHEWWNGEGYPLGLKEEEIPLECRILSIVDAYDAMTNDRPYRRAISPEMALEELKRCAGTQFDPKLVQKFLQILENKKTTLQVV